MGKETFDSLTPEAQAIVQEVGREWSVAHGQIVTQRQQGALANWETNGGTITRIGTGAKAAWLNALPSLGTEWVERNAAAGPSDAILKAYLDGMAAKGHQPLRDWRQ
jgi:TRAP-type C4-dicarboxylate transport system substrate-binding protein